MTLFRLPRCLMFCGVLFATGCATVGKVPTEPVGPAAPPDRAELLRWYDDTRPAYYDLRGPVQRVERHINDELRVVLEFSAQGRLERRTERNGDEVVEVRVGYDANGRTHTIEALQNGVLLRTTRADYVAGDRPGAVRHEDHQNGSVLGFAFDYAELRDGYRVTARPVEGVGVDEPEEYGADGALRWSYGGVANTGVGKRFLLNTADRVTAARLARGAGGELEPRAGYRYVHDHHGNPVEVASYNGNNDKVLHVTRYQYDSAGRLLREHRSVVGQSVFNTVVPGRVEYTYSALDSHGNWTQRTLIVQDGQENYTLHEQRELTYWP